MAEMIAPEYQETYDMLDTIVNFCQTAQLLIRTENYQLLATQIEAAQMDFQELLEKHCAPDE